MIIIILGLTAAQIQEHTNLNLDVASLYDIDARRFRGPIAVRYQVADRVIDLPESELVSLSFRMGMLTSADITPHRSPLDGAEAAKLCQELNKTFLGHGFSVPAPEAREFKKFVEQLKLGQIVDPLPSWRFGWDGPNHDSVNIVIRPFESASSTGSDVKRYTIMLEFGNSYFDDIASEKMNTLRKKYFPDRRGQIPLLDYPKQ